MAETVAVVTFAISFAVCAVSFLFCLVVYVASHENRRRWESAPRKYRSIRPPEVLTKRYVVVPFVLMLLVAVAFKILW